MMRVGFIGWRGMVGSVLMDRMRAEGDFDLIPEAVFFTTSQVVSRVRTSDRAHARCRMPSPSMHCARWISS